MPVKGRANKETMQRPSMRHPSSLRQAQGRLFVPSASSGQALRLSSSFTLALAAITLLGLGVRLYGLTGYGVWFDEAYHVQLVQLPSIPAMLDAVLHNPPSDPLYVLLLRGWTAMFGYSDGAVRMLSVIFSTATLPATYWLGCLMGGKRAGLLGAALLALSPYAVELGQEAALYALASLLTTLALAAGWRWRSTGQGGAFLIALGILAIYSHYVVAPILAGFAVLGLHPAFGRRVHSARGWLGAFTLIGLVWLPWLVTLALYWQASPLPRATLRHAATLGELWGALVQFTSGTASLQTGARPLQALGLLASAGLLVGGWLAVRQMDERRKACPELAEGTKDESSLAVRHRARGGPTLLLLLSGIIFFVPWAVSAATGLWLFIPHFMLFLLPALLAVVASQWSAASDHPKAHLSLVPRPSSRLTFHVLLALWLVAQVWGLALYNLYPPHGADGLRELAGVLRAEAQPGEVVLVTPPALAPSLRQYYGGELRGLPEDFDLRRVYLPYEPGEWYAASTEALEAATEGRARFWLVYYRPELDDEDRFLKETQAKYRLLSERQYTFATLYSFEKP